MELEHYLCSKSPLIVALQETWLNKKTYQCRIPGYVCTESKSELNRGGTGLLLAVKENSGLNICEYKSTPHWMTAKVFGKFQNGDDFRLLVTNVHIPSFGIRKKSALLGLQMHLKNEFLKDKSVKIILLGDFNMDCRGISCVWKTPWYWYEYYEV